MINYVEVMPIFKGREMANAGVSLVQEYGTASYLGENYFITAGHSLIPPDAPEFLHIALPLVIDETSKRGREVHALPIRKCEIHQEYDIGIAQVEGDLDIFPHLVRIKWGVERLAQLQDFHVKGFPLALDVNKEFDVYTSRAYKGYVISRIPYKIHKKQIEVYELSTPVPRGMSGAPLISDGKVAGIVRGTRQTSFVLLLEKEIDDTGEERTVLVREEVLHFGIAIPSYLVCEIESPMLGSTVGDYLISQDLLAR